MKQLNIRRRMCSARAGTAGQVETRVRPLVHFPFKIGRPAMIFIIIRMMRAFATCAVQSLIFSAAATTTTTSVWYPIEW